MKKIFIIITIVIIFLVAIYFAYIKLKTKNENEENVSEEVVNIVNENNTETNELTNSTYESNTLKEETNTTNTLENDTISTTTAKVDSRTLSFLYLSASSYIGNGKSVQDVQICLSTIIALNKGNAEISGKFIAISINGKNIGTEGSSNLSSTELEQIETEIKQVIDTLNQEKTYTISASFGADKYMSKITIEEE